MNTEKTNALEIKSPENKSGSKMQSSQLMKLFEDELKDIYWAEKALIKALPEMAKNATSKALIDALNSHLEETKEQTLRIEQIFEIIEKKAIAEKCEAMEGLIKEAIEIMESSDEGAMRDAGIISAAQKVEHYEIATYGTLWQFAETLEMDKVADLLGTTLQEEKDADSKLSDIAMDAINIKAAEQPAK
jgi:ferritin-like metal-binding protein YciE